MSANHTLNVMAYWALPAQVLSLFINGSVALIALLGKIKRFPVYLKVKDRVVLFSLVTFALFSSLVMLADLTLHTENLSSQHCAAVFKHSSWAWAAYNGALYLFLFRKWKATDMNSKYTARDKLILTVIAAYPTVVGFIIWAFSTGVFLEDRGSGPHICVFQTSWWIYSLAAVCDTAFSGTFLFLFVSPLLELKSVRPDNKFEKIVKRNLVSGVIAISSTLAFLLFGVWLTFHTTELGGAVFFAGVATDLLCNQLAIFYSMLPAWKWKDGDETVFGSSAKKSQGKK